MGGPGAHRGVSRAAQPSHAQTWELVSARAHLLRGAAAVFQGVGAHGAEPVARWRRRRGTRAAVRSATQQSATLLCPAGHGGACHAHDAVGQLPVADVAQARLRSINEGSRSKVQQQRAAPRKTQTARTTPNRQEAAWIQAAVCAIFCSLGCRTAPIHPPPARARRGQTPAAAGPSCPCLYHAHTWLEVLKGKLGGTGCCSTRDRATPDHWRDQAVETGTWRTTIECLWIHSSSTLHHKPIRWLVRRLYGRAPAALLFSCAVNAHPYAL